MSILCNLRTKTKTRTKRYDISHHQTPPPPLVRTIVVITHPNRWLLGAMSISFTCPTRNGKRRRHMSKKWWTRKRGLLGVQETDAPHSRRWWRDRETVGCSKEKNVQISTGAKLTKTRYLQNKITRARWPARILWQDQDTKDKPSCKSKEKGCTDKLTGEKLTKTR